MNHGAELLLRGETVFKSSFHTGNNGGFFSSKTYQKLGLYLIFILHVGEHRGKWPPRGARGQGVAGARQPQPGALPGGEQACLGASVWMAFHLAFALTARALDKWCRPVQVKSILTFASGVTGL